MCVHTGPGGTDPRLLCVPHSTEDINQYSTAPSLSTERVASSLLVRVPVFFGATDLGLHHPLLLVFNGVLSCKLEESLLNYLVSWNLVEAGGPYGALHLVGRPLLLRS